MDAPIFLEKTATELRNLLQKKEIRAAELVEASIAEIERNNDVINAITTKTFELAQKTAEDLDSKHDKTGKLTGLLHGLPIAVKDGFAMKDVRMTHGNILYKDHIADHDSIIVSREKNAGAVIVGKSNQPDCGSGGVTENDVFGRTLNPWNPKRTTSGSGGGAAAALGSGMVALADGSDVGGSVRTPAAWTNMVGFRPSSGVIADRPEKSCNGATCTHGIFARTVEDAALFMQAVAGPNVNSYLPYPKDVKFDYENLDLSLSDVKVRFLHDFSQNESHPDMQSIMKDWNNLLDDENAKLDYTSAPFKEDLARLYPNWNAYAQFRGLPPLVRQAALAGEDLKPSLKSGMQRYFALSPLAIMEMHEARHQLIIAYQNFMQNHDVMITVCHADPAFPANIGHGWGDFDWSQLYLAPLVGMPSIVIPGGFFNSDGMPAGLMLHGKYGQDQKLLQIAHSLEQCMPFYRQSADLAWVNAWRH